MRRRSSHQVYRNNTRGYGDQGKHAKPPYVNSHHNLTNQFKITRFQVERGLVIRLIKELKARSRR
jgi:hypothetical protein